MAACGLQPVTFDIVGNMSTVDEAMAVALKKVHLCSLLITNYTFHSYPKDEPVPQAVPLLTKLRGLSVGVPVLVFASRAQDLDERKDEVMRLGAVSYCYRFEDLFKEIARVLDQMKVVAVMNKPADA